LNSCHSCFVGLRLFNVVSTAELCHMKRQAAYVWWTGKDGRRRTHGVLEDTVVSFIWFVVKKPGCS